MNELSTQELQAIEAQTAAQESTWLVLQKIAASNPPAWKHADESIDTQSGSIHGKGK
jgi:hypothetical protein